MRPLILDSPGRKQKFLQFRVSNEDVKQIDQALTKINSIHSRVQFSRTALLRMSYLDFVGRINNEEVIVEFFIPEREVHFKLKTQKGGKAI